MLPTPSPHLPRVGLPWCGKVLHPRPVRIGVSPRLSGLRLQGRGMIDGNCRPDMFASVRARRQQGQQWLYIYVFVDYESEEASMRTRVNYYPFDMVIYSVWLGRRCLSCLDSRFGLDGSVITCKLVSAFGGRINCKCPNVLIRTSSAKAAIVGKPRATSCASRYFQCMTCSADSTPRLYRFVALGLLRPKVCPRICLAEERAVPSRVRTRRGRAIKHRLGIESMNLDESLRTQTSPKGE
jgi:hypothetical protein